MTLIFDNNLILYGIKTKNTKKVLLNIGTFTMPKLYLYVCNRMCCLLKVNYLVF